MGFVLIAVLAFCVWPTPYCYERFKLGEAEYPIRINRFTGASKVIMGNTVEPPQRLPQDELRQLNIERNSEIDENTQIKPRFFACEVYNGSDWTLTRIRISLTLRNSRQSGRDSAVGPPEKKNRVGDTIAPTEKDEFGGVIERNQYGDILLPLSTYGPREFDLEKTDRGSPRTMVNFGGDIGDVVAEGQKWECRLVAAWGYPASN